MILSYLTHKKMDFAAAGMKVIATRSPVAYRDIVQSFQCQSNLLVCSDDKYNPLEVAKTFDFVGDPLLSGDVCKKYLLNIAKTYVANLDEVSRNKIFLAFQNLEMVLEDSLLLEDLPLEISFDEDLKKLLKLVELHFNPAVLTNPYAIIETILKIHQACDLKTIPVICNVAHYLDKQELEELSELSQQMGMSLLLIEFTSPDLLVVPRDVQLYYIDEDLVDWY